MPRKRVKRAIGVNKTKLQLMKQAKLAKTLRSAAAKTVPISSGELLNIDSELSDNEMTANADVVSSETNTTTDVDMELDTDIHCESVATEDARNEDSEADAAVAADVSATEISVEGVAADMAIERDNLTINDSETNLNMDETVNENLCEKNAENCTENKDENINGKVVTQNENIAGETENANIENNDGDCDLVTNSEKDAEDNASVELLNADEQEMAMAVDECEEQTAENSLFQGDTIYEVTEIETVDILDDEDNEKSDENVTKNVEGVAGDEANIVEMKPLVEVESTLNVSHSEPEVVNILDSNEENGGGNPATCPTESEESAIGEKQQKSTSHSDQSSNGSVVRSTNQISDAIVREEIDLNLDSADLEILDERVERSINAEIEKENQMVNEAKNSKVSKENSKQSLTNSTMNSAGDKKKSESRRNLWVCNIPSTTRANDLKQTFAKYGKVIGAKIVVNTRSPGSKYYGYVTMDTEKDANNCIKFLNNSNFNGQKITIEKVNSEKDVTLNNSSCGSGSGSGTSSNNTGNASKPKKTDSPTPSSETTSSSGSGAKNRSKSYDKGNSGSGPNANNDRNGTSNVSANNSSGNADHGKRDVSRTRSTSKSTSMQRELDREKQRLKEKWRSEFQSEMTRERDRISRLEERLRKDMDSRQKHMERRLRDEERRLERERDELRKEREKLEKEKNELWRMEREKARQEREKLEREREELKRQKKLIDEENSRSLKRSAPSPPQIRNTSHSNKDTMRRDLIDDMVPQPPAKRRYDPQPIIDNYDRVPLSTSLSSMTHKDDRLPKAIDGPSSYSKYDSEAAMYLARMERENRSGPKDLRYTLMESASFRNAPLEPPAPPTNLDRKSREHSHRYLDDLPKDHMSSSRSAYDRPVRPTSPLNKFHSMSNSSSQSSAPPPHWNSSRSINNSVSSVGEGGVPGVGPGISSSSTSSDALRWNQPSNSVSNNCRITGGGSSSSSSSQSIYPNSSSMSRQHQNPMAMHQQQQQQQQQSPWSSSQVPSNADYNIHGNISSNNTYPMSSYDNYKPSMNRNKY